jgi:hypothetical protein
LYGLIEQPQNNSIGIVIKNRIDGGYINVDKGVLFPYKSLYLGDEYIAISFNGEFHPSIGKFCLPSDYDCIAFALIVILKGLLDQGLSGNGIFGDWRKDKTRLNAPYNPAFKNAMYPLNT